MKKVSIALISLLMSASAFANTVSIATGISNDDVGYVEAACTARAAALQSEVRVAGVEVSANTIEVSQMQGCPGDCDEQPHQVVISAYCDLKVTAPGMLSVTTSKFKYSDRNCSAALAPHADAVLQNAYRGGIFGGTCVVDSIVLK